MTKAQNAGKPSTCLQPTRINTNEFTGTTLYYERVSDQALVEAGLVAADQLHGGAFNSVVRTKSSKIRRMKDGSVSAQFEAEEFLARSTDFKRFLGGLMSDTRLSLVRGESRE